MFAHGTELPEYHFYDLYHAPEEGVGVKTEVKILIQRCKSRDPGNENFPEKSKMKGEKAQSRFNDLSQGLIKSAITKKTTLKVNW